MALPRTFWRFAGSSALSNLADGLYLVALPLLALQLTRSPLGIAGLTVAARLPWLFALLAGVLADRADRRRLLWSASLLRAGVLGVVAVLTFTGVVTLWQLYVVALVLGTAETVFDTTAQSTLPRLVQRDQLASANSRLYGVEVVAGFFLGPPLGGLLAGLSLGLVLVTSGTAYVVAALLLLGLAGSFAARREGRTSVYGDAVEGLRYLWGHAMLRRLALLTGGIALTSSASTAVFPLWALDPGPLGLTPASYGLLFAATGAGAVTASLSADRLVPRIGRIRSLRLAVLGISAALAPPLLGQVWLVVALFVVSAYLIITWNVVTVSWRQRLVPDALLGRVNASYRVLSWGSGPVGALAGGAVGSLLGVGVALAAAAAGAGLLLLGLRGLTDEQLGA